MKIYGYTVVNSEGFNGNESFTRLFTDRISCIKDAYDVYKSFIEENSEYDPEMTDDINNVKKAYAILKSKYILIQYDDHHIQIEYFEKTIGNAVYKRIDDISRQIASDNNCGYISLPDEVLKKIESIYRDTYDEDDNLDHITQSFVIRAMYEILNKES